MPNIQEWVGMLRTASPGATELLMRRFELGDSITLVVSLLVAGVTAWKFNDWIKRE